MSEGCGNLASLRHSFTFNSRSLIAHFVIGPSRPPTKQNWGHRIMYRNIHAVTARGRWMSPGHKARTMFFYPITFCSSFHQPIITLTYKKYTLVIPRRRWHSFTSASRKRSLTHPTSTRQGESCAVNEIPNQRSKHMMTCFSSQRVKQEMQNR